MPTRYNLLRAKGAELEVTSSPNATILCAWEPNCGKLSSFKLACRQ